MDSAWQPWYTGRRWQALAALISGGSLIALLSYAYATVYTSPDLQVWWLAALMIVASRGMLILSLIGTHADIVLARSLGFYLPLVAGLAVIGRHAPENRNAPCAS